MRLRCVLIAAGLLLLAGCTGRQLADRAPGCDGVTETCNGVDDDCDAIVDESPADECAPAPVAR